MTTLTEKSCGQRYTTETGQTVSAQTAGHPAAGVAEESLARDEISPESARIIEEISIKHSKLLRNLANR